MCYTYLRMNFRIIGGLLVLSALALAVERGDEIRLWPGGAPGSEGVTPPEVLST